MCSLESFKIDLKGLKTDVAVLEYDLDDAFFRAVEATEVSRGQVHVLLTIHKIGACFSLDIHCEGIVTVPCNRCLDDMELPVTADHQLVARFGTADGDDEADMVMVDERDGVLDVSWIVYEQVALAIPIHHVHPEGTCNAGMIRVLEDYSIDRDNAVETDPSGDPRWAKLKDLIK